MNNTIQFRNVIQKERAVKKIIFKNASSNHQFQLLSGVSEYKGKFSDFVCILQELISSFFKLSQIRKNIYTKKFLINFNSNC